MPRFALLFCACAVVFAVGAPAAQAPALQRPGTLEQTEIGRAVAALDEPTAALVRAFYAARDDRPAWFDANGREASNVLLGRMAAADRDGLPSARYATASLHGMLTRPGQAPSQQAAADVALTRAFVRFVTELARGVEDGQPSARDVDVPRVLATASDADSARHALATLEPRHHQYGLLRRALERYRGLADAGGWTAVPTGTRLKLEDPAEDVAEETPEDTGPPDPARAAAILALCRRLAASSDLGGGLPESTGCAPADPAYTRALADAVQRFQARHGLVPDGIVGPRTIAALNVPAADKALQIAINMDRWRRLPDDLGDVHVHVNIPGFRLEVVEGGRTALDMRVVAGEAKTPTPVMADSIGYLEFRPYWNVPRSITHGELLPAIAADPSYLTRNRFEVVDGWTSPAVVVAPSSIDWSAAHGNFPYRLRQRPGPHNSLGLVKFMFPNEFNVYLHDTPATHRFEAVRRAFSHGCVRVEDPVSLAAFLLRDDPAWSRETVESAMQSGWRKVVTLPAPVPVYLSYFTAWIDADVVQFRRDLYGHDRRAAARLEGETGRSAF